jgi:deazaflavin-dependent oxidoreductase (nitroreductase family)
MPLPVSIGPFNRVIANRVLGPLSHRMRPFATISHRGRLTGKPYDTVVWAFERDGRLAVALTYGTDVDWVKNLLAAGGGSVTLGGEEFEVANPRLVGDDEGSRFMPAPVRRALRLIDVHDYVVADRV